MLKKRERPEPAQQAPRNRPSLSPILPSFSRPRPCCPRIRSNPNRTRANPSPRTILLKPHPIRSSSAPKTLAKCHQAATQELEPHAAPPLVKPELWPSTDDPNLSISSPSLYLDHAHLLDMLGCCFYCRSTRDRKSVV